MTGKVIDLMIVKSEGYYPLVRIKPLTARELRNRDLEEYLFSVAVSFKTSSGRPYTATHFQNSSVSGPVVRLRSELPEEEKDFGEVEKIVHKLIGGSQPRREPLITPGGIQNSEIYFNVPLTQGQIADFVHRYEEEFRDVVIIQAVFLYVPKLAYENSNLKGKSITPETIVFY